MNTTEMDISEQRAALANRLVGDLTASMETLGVWLGLRLGLYAALDRNGPATAAELASAAGIDARYAREWVEQQAVAGVLVTRDAARDAEDRRYALPAPHREVLLDEVSPYFVAPVTYALVGIARVLPDLLTAYRTGAGVPFTAYGDEIRDHIEQLNRPMFVNDLAATWLPAVPDLHTRLQADPPARVAEIACGARLGVDRAGPRLPQGPRRRVRPRRGVDPAGHPQRGGERRRRPGQLRRRDAADPELAGRYHAALVFEALHDTPGRGAGRDPNAAGRRRLRDRR
ncbi:MAG: hypothetical protein ACRDST_12730 [Pseudonocardiaceae bacterium]